MFRLFNRMFRQNFQQSNKKFYSTSSEGIIHQTMTKESITKDGWKIIERINVVKNWKTYTRIQKILLSSYLGIGLAKISFSTYNDGKTALLECREQMSKITGSKTNENIALKEWAAVKSGCNEHIVGNIFSGALFPITMITGVMPQLILSLNKK